MRQSIMFLPRAAMRQHGLCHRAMSVRLFVRRSCSCFC